MEFEAVADSVMALPTGGESQVGDLSSFIHCDLKDEDQTPWNSGYFFQFGCRYNTMNRLLIAGANLQSDLKPTIRITPEKTHHIVVENEVGDLRFFVDGDAVLTGTAKNGLIGKGYNHVGIYFFTTAKVITRRKGTGTFKPLPYAIQETMPVPFYPPRPLLSSIEIVHKILVRLARQLNVG
jgi:hypothetical protein